MAIPQPTCPIAFPTFIEDRGSTIVDPLTGSSLNKTDSYVSNTQCDDPEFIKFNSGVTIIALDSTTCQKVPTAGVTVKGYIPYCTDDPAQVTQLVNLVVAQIISDLGLTP